MSRGPYSGVGASVKPRSESGRTLRRSSRRITAVLLVPRKHGFQPRQHTEQPGPDHVASHRGPRHLPGAGPAPPDADLFHCLPCASVANPVFGFRGQQWRRINPDTGLVCGKPLFLLNDWPIAGHTNSPAVAPVLHTAPSASSHRMSNRLPGCFPTHRPWIARKTLSQSHFHIPHHPGVTARCPHGRRNAQGPSSEVAPTCNSVLPTGIAQTRPRPHTCFNFTNNTTRYKPIPTTAYPLLTA